MNPLYSGKAGFYFGGFYFFPLYFVINNIGFCFILGEYFTKTMAEQEVIKHTKKVYNIWTSKEHSLWHKVKEFFLEILIIVFAVTLSIWLHEWSEHSHQQKEVKEFLLGLKSDLQNDIKEMKADRQTFFKSRDAFRFIVRNKLGETLDGDSIRKHEDSFFNLTGLIANSGRFEGFKSSGKIGLIEDQVLQNDIMDLYQENITNLVGSTNYYSSVKQKLIDYYNLHVKRVTDSTNNVDVVLSSDEVRNLANSLTDIRDIVKRYDHCIANSQKIIDEIDEEYKIK